MQYIQWVKLALLNNYHIIVFLFGTKTLFFLTADKIVC